jgi:hypothetical protein
LIATCPIFVHAFGPKTMIAVGMCKYINRIMHLKCHAIVSCRVVIFCMHKIEFLFRSAIHKEVFFNPLDIFFSMVFGGMYSAPTIAVLENVFEWAGFEFFYPCCYIFIRKKTKFTIVSFEPLLHTSPRGNTQKEKTLEFAYQELHARNHITAQVWSLFSSYLFILFLNIRYFRYVK